MLHFVVTRLFDSPAQTLVNTVNTVGVMGKGIAAEFKQRYPEMYRKYRQHCVAGHLTIGKLYLYRTENKWILNFPTKAHWRNPSKLEYIEAGLEKFVQTYSEHGITSISFPQLGTGNGGLDWDDVRPLMEKYLTPLPISVYIHGVRKRGDFVPEHMDRATKKELRLPRIDITFDEFLHDLQEIVGVHLDNNVRASTADEPDPLPRIQCDFGESGSVVIDGEEFATLWHDLRVHGALQTNDFPGSLGVHSDDVARMLTQLDYIRPMAFEDPPDAIGGIRFAPSGNKDRPTHQSVIPERETLD